MKDLLSSREKGLAFRRVTVDIDGVMGLSMIPALAWVNRKYHTNYVLGKSFLWGTHILEEILEKDLGISHEEAFAVWLEPEVMLAAPPVRGSVRAIKRLGLKGAEIYFVTARRGTLRGLTFSWLQKYLPIDPDQLLMQPPEGREGTLFKTDTIRRLSPDWHIDDSHELVVKLDGVNVVLVKQPWNQDAPSHLRKSWPEIYEMIVNG